MRKNVQCDCINLHFHRVEERFGSFTFSPTLCISSFLFLENRNIWMWFFKKLFLNFKKYVFIYLWLCRVFIAVGASSPHSEWGLLSSCGVWASHFGGSSCCRAWAVGAQASVVAARGLRGCDSRALEYRLSSCGITPWRVESSLTRNPTCVPCVGSGFFTTRSPSMWFSFALCSWLMRLSCFSPAHWPFG